MPKRPRSHQLEDQSVNEFKRLLPPQWIYRNKSHDYGIDGEVEIFTEDGKATGQIFFVQIKSTDSTEISKASIRLKLETINYYNSLDLPILLVRFLSPKNIFYVKWFHSLVSHQSLKKIKTTSIKMTSDNVLKHSFIEKLPEYLEILKAIRSKTFIPVWKVKIKFEVDEIATCLSSNIFLNILKNSKEFDTFINFVDDDEDSFVTVFINEERILVTFCDMPSAGVSFDKSRLEPKEVIRSFHNDILIAMALGFRHRNYFPEALRFFSSTEFKSNLLCSPEILSSIAWSFAVVKKYELFIALLKKRLEETGFDVSLMIACLQLIANSQDMNSEELNALRGILESISIKDPNQSSAMKYNLANSYQNSDQLRKAISMYRQAVKCNSSYLLKDYFCREVGSVLYRLGRFRWSSNWYKRSLEISFNQEILPVYADSLMFSGEYKLSLKTFNHYLSKHNNIKDTEWVLKRNLVKKIVEELGIDSQIRRPEKANKNVPEKYYEGAEKVLLDNFNLDSLHNHSWYNLACIKYEKGNQKEALECFIAAGLIKVQDLDAWTNSFVISMSTGNAVTWTSVFLVAYFYNEEEFIRHVSSRLTLNAGSPSTNSIVQELIKLASKIKTETRILEIKKMKLNLNGFFK